MPYFEICLFVDEEKSEKYSINLCVRSSVIEWKKYGFYMGEGFSTPLNVNFLSYKNIKI